jgi:hypothetical protein
MANKFTTVWELENKLYLRRLKEIEKAEKDVRDKASKALKASSKDQAKSFDAYQKSLKDKIKLENEHIKSMKAANSLQSKSGRDELKFLKNVEKHKEKAHKTFLGRVKQISRVTTAGLAGGIGASMKIGGTAARGGAALAGGALGVLMGASVAGYQRHMQVQQALAGTSGMASGRDVRGGMRNRMGARLGFNMMESAQQAATMGRATGVMGPRELQQAMRATGMGAGEVGGIYGAFARGGIGFEGAGGSAAGVRRGQSAGGREMQRMISAGMQSGLKRGRLPEFFQGVSKLMQEQQRVRVGDVGAADYSKTLALWGKTGLAGMQGMRGASILQQINQGIKRPGGGEAGKALMMQAMGFGKPGGNVGFYEAEKMRERGATSENVMGVMTEVKKQFGSGQEAALAMRETLGVSLDQAETLLKIYSSNESADEKQKKIKEEMEKSKSLEQQSRDFLDTTAAGVKRLAGRWDESVGHGAKAAKYIEKMEDWQYKLVNLMFQAVGYLEKLYAEVRFFMDFWMEGKDPATARQDAVSRRAMIDWATAENETDRKRALNAMKIATNEPSKRSLWQRVGKAAVSPAFAEGEFESVQRREERYAAVKAMDAAKKAGLSDDQVELAGRRARVDSIREQKIRADAQAEVAREQEEEKGWWQRGFGDKAWQAITGNREAEKNRRANERANKRVSDYRLSREPSDVPSRIRTVPVEVSYTSNNSGIRHPGKTNTEVNRGLPPADSAIVGPGTGSGQ